MPSRRMVQVANLLKEELSELLRRELKDPRLGFVTLTDVQVSPDFRSAQVYVSVLGEEEPTQQSLATLNRAAGFLRRELGRRLTLRYTPALSFILDRSSAQGQHIDNLLRQIHEQEASPGEE